MFLLFFALFVLIFTVFENIFVGVIFCIISLCIFSIYQITIHKKFSLKIYLPIICWFFLALGVFLWKEYNYYSNNTSSNTIVWTGIISDISNAWKYVFKYHKKEYLLYSKKEYAIWDEIRLVGKVQINMSWCMVLHTCRTVSFTLLDNPLFSWWFDYPKWLKMKGREGTIYEDNSILMNNEWWIMNNDGMWFIKKVKQGIQEMTVAAYGKNRISWLILGMLIGDRSQIPADDYQNFINSWLVHLVAVSGGNILMIVVFLQCILIFIPFYPRLGLIFLAVIWYGLICWLDSSVFRAVLMGGMNMVALFRGREINIWRLLSISGIIMLVVNPYFLVYDVGFLLSYSALIGIIYFQNNDKWEMIDDKWKSNKIQKALKYVYKNYISPSIWASIGIFPVIIFFMGKINIIWMVWNLLVLPLVPLVMIYWFISIWVYSWLRWWWLIGIEKLLIQYIYKVSELLSQYGIYLLVSWIRVKVLILIISVWFFIYRRLRKTENKTIKNKIDSSRQGFLTFF